ncbi:hypothetical protein A3J90_00385 [candidate division WOR-1 bacterium RIFOXYC2_FULL_37_10]|uniref:Indole-3-glycerol phosphate synthase n=1 Tax=candidate division WOR-1 bacterium RIFOXYB2_FULL_37_13 TaxID=1802579 RepID=A0A1F4SMR3_UNCSA|nr:MAG: hypothetical protein A2246_02985 [candidate division WOR-1 bacterium RIFOXYA2_FULL_37_7]OGC21726.1 MAG: hypothetical protein A2310_00270 [candidate division WOR-1 bacterium RIFOXYB2_FULL_37_13]OGC32588.1 MAG: hypothetical protein A3J90_00385 [candidate division WOR-1 bacterium RIFOXYC2_FULL_37_10]
MILDEIILTKRKEIEALKERLATAKTEFDPNLRDFKSSINQENKISLIAEIKKASPSAGIIVKNFDPVSIAKQYESSGAFAISVLTDKTYFQGEIGFLKQVRAAVKLPVFRKDFIIDELQITESRIAGADAILLIARILELPDLSRFLEKAKELGLQVLLETHDEYDIEKALSLNCDIVGINNRNLDTLKVDFNNSLKLLDKFPELKSRILVSESGISEKSQIDELKSAGFSAVLIGESLLKSEDVLGKMREMFGNNFQFPMSNFQ